MKKLKYIIYSALVVGMFASCADEPLPFETFDELQKGAFPRQLTNDGQDFFFTDPDNSSFSITMEYFSENNGAEIAAHEWQVFHRDNANGGAISAGVVLLNAPSSSFGTNDKSGLPQNSYTFALNDALAALGLTIDDVNGGDDIIFDGFLIMNDGRRFGPGNTGGSVQSDGGFDGRFRYIKSLKCPSDLDGTYSVSTVVTNQGAGISWDGCEGNTWEGKMDLVTVVEGEYIFRTHFDDDNKFDDMSMGAFYACYGTTSEAGLPNGADGAGGTVRFKDACEIVSFAGTSQWGEVYTIEVFEFDGRTLTFEWSNDYGEGAVSQITPDDPDFNWPPLRQ